MLLGYVRAVQGNEDGLLVQWQALQDAGCEQLVKDLTSGGRWDQPGLREVLDRLREGDVVVPCRLKCLGQFLQDVVRVVHALRPRATAPVPVIEWCRSSTTLFKSVFTGLTMCRATAAPMSVEAAQVYQATSGTQPRATLKTQPPRSC